MPDLDNKELLGRLLRSTIGVISRRTSDTYANLVIGTAISSLKEKYRFLEYVNIKKTQFKEVFDVVEINDAINFIEFKEIAEAMKDFIGMITNKMGKNAGFYFIREIKEDIPFDYEKQLTNSGFDLDYLQLQFLTDVKDNYKFKIENVDIVKNIMKSLFEILESMVNRDFAFNTINELVGRLGTKYDTFTFVKVNDVRAIKNVDIVTVYDNINSLEDSEVGAAIQKIIQEIDNNLEEKGGFNFLEKIKTSLTSDYNFRIKEMGVNLEVIKLKKILVVKHVLKALADILSEYSTESYAIMLIHSGLKKYSEKYSFLNGIKIDAMHFSEGIDSIIVPQEIENVRESELGRSLQKIVENISTSLGEDAGEHFIDKFKNRLGKAYLLRIEEMGVNLHMIELKRSMTW